MYKYVTLLLILCLGWNWTSSATSAYVSQDSVPKHESFIISSLILGEERRINVWLPDNYAFTEDSFPVMYMADGGVGEDFPHIANTIATLIQEGKLPPMLLIGIENTQRRRDLTGFTAVAKDKTIAPIVGGSTTFRAFIKDELFKEINTRFKVKGKRSIIGESLAGLFVIETLLLAPEMFDHYIAFDPSLWWNDHYLIKIAKDHLSKNIKSDKTLWMTSSKAKDIKVWTKQLADQLNDLGLAHLKWYYSYDGKETHSTIFRAKKNQALIWTFNQ